MAMHTDTIPKEKPTGSANNPAGHTDSVIVPNPGQRIKSAFIRLASWLAVLFRGVA
jgi:hypothetical protein